MAEGPRPFVSLGELCTALEAAVTDGSTEDLWRRVEAAGRMPLVFGRTAVFLYRGEGETVEWRGDLDGWEEGPTTHGERIGSTDLWWKIVQLPPGSRLDYKIVVDGTRWLLDPLNPLTQLGGYGPNSEARIPPWQPPAIAARRLTGPRGSLGEPRPVTSKALGYDVDVRLYTPAGVETETGPYPLLVVTDGSDYWHDEMGSLPIILDNLIADGALPPLFALFVDPWDRVANVNRREQEMIPAGPGVSPFLAFLTDELLPMIASEHPIDRSGKRTAILGTSLGGLFATFAASTRPDRFGLVAIQSPNYWPAPWLLDTIAEARALPTRAFIDVGLYERDFIDPISRVRGLLEKRGVEVLYREVLDGHSWGHWRATVADGLTFLFSDLGVDGALPGRRLDPGSRFVG